MDFFEEEEKIRKWRGLTEDELSQKSYELFNKIRHCAGDFFVGNNLNDDRTIIAISMKAAYEFLAIVCQNEEDSTVEFLLRDLKTRREEYVEMFAPRKDF